MAIHRTALGKTIDMSALAAKNERVRAVGNMSVNARGDTIDSFGKVIKPATEKVNEKYAKTVGNRSAQISKDSALRQPVKPDIIKPKATSTPAPVIEKEELTKEELELDEFDDIEIEEIKAQETKKK